MAINANSSSDQVVQGRRLFTGLIDYKVIAINPTLKESEKIEGITLRKEPEYLGKTEDGEDKIRIDFFVESVNCPSKIVTKVPFWLENKVRTNNNGDKHELINSKGNSTWTSVEDAEGKDAPDWFDKEGIRVSQVGEAQLYSFIQAWLNVNPKDDCVLDTDWSKMCKGDLKELRNLMKSFPNNTLTLCTTVVENGGNYYQQIWPGYFGRSSVKDRTVWKRKMENPYPEIKGDYGGTFNIQEYDIDVESQDGEEPASLGNDADGSFGGTQF